MVDTGLVAHCCILRDDDVLISRRSCVFTRHYGRFSPLENKVVRISGNVAGAPGVQQSRVGWRLVPIEFTYIVTLNGTYHNFFLGVTIHEPTI